MTTSVVSPRLAPLQCYPDAVVGENVVCRESADRYSVVGTVECAFCVCLGHGRGYERLYLFILCQVWVWHLFLKCTSTTTSAAFTIS